MTSNSTSFQSGTTNVEGDMDERLGLGSASGAERDFHCPGNRQIAALCPKQESSEVAEKGTAIHKAWETGDDSELEDTDAEIMAERLKRLEIEATDTFRGGREPRLIMREERLWVRHPKTLEPLYSSKVDYGEICGTDAFLGDGKTGYRRCTPAHKNYQLMVQAVSLKHEHPEVTSVTVALLQPRQHGAAKMESTTYGPEDLKAAERELIQAIWRTKQPGAQRIPGEWCRYCPARGAYCRESASWALLEAAENKPVEVMTIQELAVMKRKASVVNSMFEAAVDRLKTCTPEELKEVGLTMVDGYSIFTVTNPLGLWNEVADVLPMDEVTAAMKLSTTALEKSMKKATKLKGKGFDEHWKLFQASMVMKNLAQYKQSSPRLVDAIEA